MKLSKINFLTFGLLFIFFGFSNYAQISTQLNQFKKKYPTSDKINLIKELSINIEINNDEILITQSSLDEDIYINESATQYSKEAVSYSTFFQLESIEASSFSIENEKYVENKVSKFLEKDDLNGSFYDDVKSLNFIYSNLNPGSKTRLKLKEKIMNPRFLGAFYFGGYFPVLNSKLTITADKDVELHFKEFNIDSLNIDFKKIEKRTKTTYTWEVKNVNSIKMEDQTPSFKNYYPHIVPIIKQYTTKSNKVVKLSSDVTDLYNWYYSLVEGINKTPLDSNLVNLVNDLTNNKPSEIEKVRAIYYWVQNNIKYIAFEYALGGFIPREANDIYNKKYGDCKDNSSILYEMLKIANIKGNLTWVGTRSIPYTYSQLPTPAVDNHMILAYQNNDKTYFLDATGRYIPLELPTSFIQGKEALIGNGFNNFEIQKVPVIEANFNTILSSSTIQLHDKELKGKATQTFSGYPKIDLFNKLESINSPNKLQEYYTGLLQKGNNKFLPANIIESHKFDYDTDFSIDYNFTIQDYVIKTVDEIFVNLNLDRKVSEYKVPDSRKTDIEVDYKKKYSFKNQFTIPEGYEVAYLPENESFSNNLISASISYQQIEKQIIYTHTINLNFLVLPKGKQPEYNNIIKKIEKAYKEIIILKKSKN